MNYDIKQNIKQPSTWKWGGYILLFAIFYQMAIALLFLIIAFQFVHKLITGNTNQQLHKLSRSISSYIYQILQFMSFNSHYIPYPFGEWPEDEQGIIGKPADSKTGVDDIQKKADPAGDADGD